MISVGFIGIGNMGSPMVLNLLKAGHAVTVFDINEAAYSQLMDAGVALANSALEAAVGVDVVITMLPNDKIVEDMYLGEHGLIAHLELASDCLQRRRVPRSIHLCRATQVDRDAAGNSRHCCMAIWP